MKCLDGGCCSVWSCSTILFLIHAGKMWPRLRRSIIWWLLKVAGWSTSKWIAVQSNSRAWSSRKEILDLFVEEQRLHIAWHRFSFSGSWLLPPKISERTWEKVALVVCIKDK